MSTILPDSSRANHFANGIFSQTGLQEVSVEVIETCSINTKDHVVSEESDRQRSKFPEQPNVFRVIQFKTNRLKQFFHLNLFH